MEDREVRLALKLLRSDPDLIADARRGASVSNTVAGALLTRPIGPSGARQYAEAAVRRALSVLDHLR